MKFYFPDTDISEKWMDATGTLASTLVELSKDKDKRNENAKLDMKEAEKTVNTIISMIYKESSKIM